MNIKELFCDHEWEFRFEGGQLEQYFDPEYTTTCKIYSLKNGQVWKVCTKCDKLKNL